MLPLPPSVIKHLSPNTYRLYQQTLPGYDLENRKSPSGCKFNFLKSPHHSFTQSWKSLSIYRHATRTEFLKILAYIGIFFLIINNIKTRRQVNRLILCIILVGCFEAFYGLLEYLSGHQHIFFIKKKYYNDCVTGTYINRNHLAGYLGMVIPVAFGLLIARSLNYSFIHTGSWRHRLSGIESYLSKNSLIIFAAIVMILTLIFSQSRMGIFSLLCSLSFMSLVIIASSRERRKRTFISISTLVIILVLWGSWIGLNPVVERFSSVFREWASEGGRPVIWKDTVNLVKDFPALGTGLGTYIYIFPKYKTIRARLLYDHAHNDYLEYLSEIGIIGILIMLAGIALFIIKIIKRWQKRRDAYVRGMTLGGLTGIVAIILHSAADFNLHIPANALLLAIIMGLTFNMVNLKSAGRRRVTE
jgi:O-antigen ligase